MKTARSHEPVRWRERDADTHALEARAAALTDAARQVAPLGAEAVSRIRGEVLEQAAGRDRVFDFRRRPIVARVAVGLALLLMCAATADGASILWRRHRCGSFGWCRRLDPRRRRGSPRRRRVRLGRPADGGRE